jgi:hypothetical protein
MRLVATEVRALFEKPLVGRASWWSPWIRQLSYGLAWTVRRARECCNVNDSMNPQVGCTPTSVREVRSAFEIILVIVIAVPCDALKISLRITLRIT